jgi:hypothetical protein
MLLLFGLAACNRQSAPRPARYVMDSGASGWVTVIYNQPDAPELPVEDGFAVIRVPASMKVATRSRMNPFFDGSEFYYQGPDGKRVRLSSQDGDQRRLWGLEKKPADTEGKEVFFVGKSEEFTHVFRAAGDLGTGLLQSKQPKPEDEKTAPVDLNPDHLKIETELPK